MNHTNTLKCEGCGLRLSPSEAYGTERDTCPNASCRDELTLTDKGRRTLVTEQIEKYRDE